MNTIDSKLIQFISQLQVIQTNLENMKKTSDPNEGLTQDVFSKLIGAAAEELFESPTASKLGKAWTKNKFKTESKQKQEQFRINLEYNFQSILEQVRSFLGTISVEKPNLKQSGNSNMLLKKLASIEGYTKLETKVRRTIVILNQIRTESLIYNSQIVELKKQQKTKVQFEYYETIKNLEQELRKVISNRLSKVSKNWWKQNIPEDVKINAEKCKKQNQSPWSWITRSKDAIDYIDFGDYGKIISKRDNWNNAFKEIFYNKEELLAKLSELEPIRNSIMHSRNLKEREKHRLQLYSDDIFDIIKN